MSLLHMDGFDQFSNINGSAATATTLQSAGYETTVNGTDSLLVMPGRVSNTYALRLRQDAPSGQSAYLRRTFESDADVVTIGFAYMATERSPIVRVIDLIDLLWPVGCQLNGVDGTAIPIRNIWYYYELQIDKPAQKLRLYINNKLDIEAPLPAEAQNMTTYRVQWGTGVTGSVSTTQMVDDLVLIDSNETEPGGISDRIGPVDITVRFPTSDHTAEWVGSKEGTLASLVNKRPPQADSYIQSNVSGAEATFLSSAQLPTDSPIYAIGVVVRALKTDIDRRQIGLVFGDGANRLEEIRSDLTTENKYLYGFFEQPAPGQVWTKEIVESNSFGVKVRP